MLGKCIYVLGVSMLPFPPYFDWILKLFQQCGVFYFSFYSMLHHEKEKKIWYVID